MNEVEKLIASIREATPDAETLYSNGACFHLFVTLKLHNSKAECWYDGVEGHVYTKIGEDFYDIRGRIENPPEMYLLSREPAIYRSAFGWVKSLL